MNKIFELVSKEDILNSIEYPKDSIVFLSGSIVNGIGNPKSDIDVFILYDTFSDMDKLRFQINNNDKIVELKEINKVGIDIEYWKLSEITILINKLKSMKIDRYENLSKVFPINRLSIMHRFIIGVPIYNEEKFNALLQEDFINNYMKFGMYAYINEIENVYEDIIGNYEVGRIETAYLLCNECIKKALAAYLFYKNISLDKIKWVHLLLEKLSETDEEAKMILSKTDVFLIESRYSYDIKLGVEKALEFINEIVELIQE